jgi:trans-aconitate methyltransferase
LSREESLHRDRARALSFGGVAVQYDRARPSYPSALVDTLMKWTPRTVLDVGCGTGKASRLLAARGCDVLGVEPDALMATVARNHGISVEVGTFEQWEPQHRSFDLLISAQAWHWVEPKAGVAKAASVLHPGGHLAVFWNRGHHDPAIAAALDAAYERVAPSLPRPSTELRPDHHAHDAHVGELASNGQFSAVEAQAYPWEAVYDRAAWLDFIATQSDHVMLPAAQRSALLDAVGDVIDGLGGSIPYHFSTLLLTATRVA